MAVGAHPDLAKIYLGLYPGELSDARLGRALALARFAPREAESKIAVAQAAIAASDFKAAREALQPLIDGPERPSARVCRLMAELEEKQHGAGGYIREWLTRASHAPRDATWVADGVASDRSASDLARHRQARRLCVAEAGRTPDLGRRGGGRGLRADPSAGAAVADRGGARPAFFRQAGRSSVFRRSGSGAVRAHEPMTAERPDEAKPKPRGIEYLFGRK